MKISKKSKLEDSPNP